MARQKISAGVLETLPAGQSVFDTTVLGFGARRQTEGGDVTFFFKSKYPGTQKQVLVTIGKYRRGDWTLAEARAKAAELRHMVKRGIDPMAERKAAAAAMTVSELCAAYLSDASAGVLGGGVGREKKPSTIATDASRIEAHIKPLLGKLTVPAVTSADIETFLRRVAAGDTAKALVAGRGRGARGGKGTATRTVGLLGAIFTYAVKKKLRADNPVRGVARYKDQRRERRLSVDEYRQLAAGLAATEQAHPVAAACVKFLALTGWRRGEAVNLKWKEVELTRRTATLGDTKTGRSMRPLAHAALAALGAVPRRAGSPWVFPAATGEGAIGSLPKAVARIRKLGGLPADITPHTLRHSLASQASDLGLSEASIAGLLGHKLGSVTSRYVHTADAVLLAAADKVADAVQELMDGKKPDAAIVQLHRA